MYEWYKLQCQLQIILIHESDESGEKGMGGLVDVFGQLALLIDLLDRRH